MKEPINASQYFNHNWTNYQKAISNNTLYHLEMTDVLNSFLNRYFASKPFSLADMGCGDSSTIMPVLAGKPIDQYIGIDAAPDILSLAQANSNAIRCKKEFICSDMLSAISSLPIGVDIIFSSYAIHHLSFSEKVELIKICQLKLKDDGFFILVDGVLRNNQTRNEWLKELENRIKVTQSLSEEEVSSRMLHPQEADFPEEIATFEKIALSQKWKKFEVLFEKEIYAFMVFSK